MLRELHISNLAVISDARIELAPGLNCFTGATGAGKSLVIGALEILLGLRSPADMLRKGADEGRVSGAFDIPDPDTRRRIESATDVPVSTDGPELLLTRKLYPSGRSSVSLNGKPITLAMLRAASEHLVDVHGQHDQQYLLKPSNQLDVLDAFAQATKLRQKYEHTWHQLTSARHRLADLSQGRSLRDQQLELYRFQLSEIDAADLTPGELDTLQARATVLNNVERLQKEAGGLHAALYESDNAAVPALKHLAAQLATLATLDAALAPVAASLKDAALTAEEAAYDLSRYVSKLDLDPEDLATTNDRLTLLHRLATKYAARGAALPATVRRVPTVPAPSSTAAVNAGPSAALTHTGLTPHSPPSVVGASRPHSARRADPLARSNSTSQPDATPSTHTGLTPHSPPSVVGASRPHSARRADPLARSDSTSQPDATPPTQTGLAPQSPPSVVGASRPHSARRADPPAPSTPNPAHHRSAPDSPLPPPPAPPPPPDDITLVLAFRDHLAREISHLESQTEDLSTLEASLAPLEAEARKLAAELSALRRKASTKLAKEVEAALADLGMERARFSVELSPAPDLTPTGLDVVDFIVATNPGLPASPLRKVASGGELSRVMLALKGILAAGDRVSVLVFDEIDANVGGRLGAIIGSKLRALAAGHQVLCITHLPQIAAYADRHLTVRKSQSKDATTSTVRPIEGEDRISELAEMIGGHTLTPTTRAQAQELLSSAASPPRAFPNRASAPSPTRASAPSHTPPSVNSGGGGSDPAATLNAPTATPVKHPARRKVG